MRLVLFDIDGTLLREGIAPKIAFARALRETYATAGPVGTFRFAGMTDPECVTEIMRQAGVTDEVILQRRDECLRRYVAYLEEEMPNHDGARLYPGVRELLERLNKLDDVLVGLLTGNVLRGAQLKLQRWNLEPYFRFGAFGDDHENRSVLASIALEKAQALSGRPYVGSETTVIGDTPKDIACAHAMGARCLAVATGTFAREELEPLGAWMVLDDLAKVERVVEALGI
jgi:phosphoglycolate phosphatase-like HAD superfamily hydrolase